MLNLFSKPPLNNQNSEQSKEESSINLDVKFNVKIKEEVLMKILLWLLGGSVFAGGVYGIYNNLSPAETEINNNPISQESVDRSSR